MTSLSVWQTVSEVKKYERQDMAQVEREEPEKQAHVDPSFSWTLSMKREEIFFLLLLCDAQKLRVMNLKSHCKLKKIFGQSDDAIFFLL